MDLYELINKDMVDASQEVSSGLMMSFDPCSGQRCSVMIPEPLMIPVLLWALVCYCGWQPINSMVF